MQQSQINSIQIYIKPQIREADSVTVPGRKPFDAISEIDLLWKCFIIGNRVERVVKMLWEGICRDGFI